VFEPFAFNQLTDSVQNVPWPTETGIRSDASKPMNFELLAMSAATFSL
jgi:hypothetical protein